MFLDAIASLGLTYEDQQTTNRRPTDDQQTTNRRPTDNQQMTNR